MAKSKKAEDVSLTNGAEYVNTNDAPQYIKASEDEANNPTVQGPDHSDKTLKRKPSESAAKYAKRVGNPAVQPVQPGQTKSYLGEDL